MKLVKPEIAFAELSIVDGAWQETPDNVAVFDEASLFEGALERGSLCIVVEVTGDSEGRDALARELVETARREYAASRGSIMMGLTQAVYAANDFLYNTNASLPREARRIAGMTASVLREDEIFITQAGPGVAVLVRGDNLQRLPNESQWFNPDENALGELLTARNFATPGTVPMGMRRTYIPDQFHLTLQPGDIIVLGTRTLTHLLTDQELIDTVAHKHPDEIVASLEDVAGTSDLSAIALSVEPAKIPPAPVPATPVFASATVSESGLEVAPEESITETPATQDEELDIMPPAFLAPAPELFESVNVAEPEFFQEPETPEEHFEEIESDNELPTEREPSEEDLALERARSEEEAERQRLADERRTKLRASTLGALAGVTAALAGVFGKIDWNNIGKALDRAISGVLSVFVGGVAFLLRAVVPGEPDMDIPARPVRKINSAWKLAAIVFPLLLIALGTGTWVWYRADQQRQQTEQITNWVNESKTTLEQAKRLAATDKAAAKAAAQKALNTAQQAKKLGPNHQAANTALNETSDFLDGLSGITVLQSLPLITTLDDKSKPTRIVAYKSEVYILDRGNQRVLHYTVSDTGPSSTPVPTDGPILRSGDKVGDRTATEFLDLVMLDSGKPVVLDKSGAFFTYDFTKATPWIARPANDPAAWARVTIAAQYAGNMYLLDPSRNQILKYVAPSEGAWSSSVTYFAPNFAPDMSNIADVAIDGDVWILRSDGLVLRYVNGRPVDFPLKDFDTPLSKPTALFTTPQMSALYIADAGNQRIVQVDKTTGKLLRQFKPGMLNKDAFKSLKALSAETQTNKFYFISGNQAYQSVIPQQQ